MRDANAGHHACGANGPGALTDLDAVGSGCGEVFHAGPAGDVTGDDGQGRECVANEPDRVADPGAVAVGGGDGGDIHTAIHEGADMVYNAVSIKIATLGTRGRYSRAAQELEQAVPRGFELRGGLLSDAF